MRATAKAITVKHKSLRLLALALMMAFVVGVPEVWTSLPASAHGESIDVQPTEARPGDSVTITGNEFPAGEEVEVLLEGVSGEIDLGHAEAGEDGRFVVAFTIPSTAAPGSYQMVAVTGDDRITLDFTILEGGAQSNPGGSTELVFQRTTTETIIIAVIAVALAAGGALIVVSGRWRHA